MEKQFHEGLKLSSAYERLVIFFCIIIYVTHIGACAWIFIAELNYTNDLVTKYMHAFYFIVTTITTVGYGDMTINTLTERVFCVVLMIFGVFLFSTVSGSLASVLSSIDNQNADLQQSVMLLKRLREQYGLDPCIYKEITRFLSFESKMAMKGLANFIESLPTTLQIAVGVSMHNILFKSHPFFKRL